MRKTLHLLAIFLLFGVFLSGASASYSITDMNISVSDGQVTIYVECYDDAGSPTNGTVNITVYNEQGGQPFGAIAGTCGYNDLSGYGTLDPGNYYVISEVVGANCNPSGICSHKQDFVVPKEFSALNIDETQPSLLVFLLPLVLFLIKRESKKS